MLDLITQINRLHSAYNQATGQSITLHAGRERDWVEWLRFRKPPFTEDDLRLVIAHIRRGIRDGARNQGALKFRNLIGNPDYFEEDLEEARARNRITRVDPGRAAALKATGRPADPDPQSAKSAKEVLDSQAFQDFCKLKENL